MKNYKFVILSLFLLSVVAYLCKKDQEKEKFTKKFSVKELSSKKIFPEHAIIFTQKETSEFLKILSAAEYKYKQKNIYIERHYRKFYELTVVDDLGKGYLQICFDTIQSTRPVSSMFFYTTNIKNNKNTKLKVYDFNSYTFDFYYLKDLKVGYGIVKMNSRFLGNLFFFDEQIKSLK